MSWSKAKLPSKIMFELIIVLHCIRWSLYGVFPSCQWGENLAPRTEKWQAPSTDLSNMVFWPVVKQDNSSPIGVFALRLLISTLLLALGGSGYAGHAIACLNPFNSSLHDLQLTCNAMKIPVARNTNKTCRM